MTEYPHLKTFQHKSFFLVLCIVITFIFLMPSAASADWIFNVDDTTTTPSSAWNGWVENAGDGKWDMRDEGQTTIFVGEPNSDLAQAFPGEGAADLTMTISPGDIGGAGDYSIYVRYGVDERVWGL